MQSLQLSVSSTARQINSKIDAAFLENVRLMIKLKIMTGTGADTFDPKGATTRAQVAVVFIRLLQVAGWID
ncbi:S-layer homology domain-containing protein [Paenibacillus sp. IHBB 10380]|uniref:S-layer homology domain-containing protein n=1 Tax=Paenibacillus sp. IHBB 10380 TaxID=1566358 RepID=UPI002D21AB62|nr:S-layer homology domain-containing protein [Paenibacillus sp. IHBB 10380]